MKYFKIEEFDCKHTGKNEMVPEFLEKIDHLRDECGFPFVVTSGYRDKTHPVEAAKKAAGVHSQGIACDIKVNTGYQRYVLLKKAFEQEISKGSGKSTISINITGVGGTEIKDITSRDTFDGETGEILQD